MTEGNRLNPLALEAPQERLMETKGRSWLHRKMTSEGFVDSGNPANRYPTSWMRMPFPGISESRPEGFFPWRAKVLFPA